MFVKVKRSSLLWKSVGYRAEKFYCLEGRTTKPERQHRQPWVVVVVSRNGCRPSAIFESRKMEKEKKTRALEQRCIYTAKFYCTDTGKIGNNNNSCCTCLGSLVTSTIFRIVAVYCYNAQGAKVSTADVTLLMFSWWDIAIANMSLSCIGIGKNSKH